ncbi:MAG: hypothetical protein JO354_06645 [Verrucomicrobia bacterium]|nr:hypothetical protein [Verrucomicrobiota bacterium]
MNDHLQPTVRDNFVEHGVGMLEKASDYHRGYALDDYGKLALGALAKAAHEAFVEGKGKTSWTREELAEQALKPLLPFIPSATQERPAPEPALPELPRDPITGEPVKNPFVEPRDLQSQAIVRRENPQLAQHLERVAKEGGVSFTYLNELKEAAAKREKLRKLNYTQTEHQNNPYRGTDLSARGEFERTHDSDTVKFYTREGATPVEFPWAGKGNLTELAQVAKHRPDLKVIVDRAGGILRDWHQQDVERLEKQRRSAEEAHKKAKAAADAARWVSSQRAART